MKKFYKLSIDLDWGMRCDRNNVITYFEKKPSFKTLKQLFPDIITKDNFDWQTIIISTPIKIKSYEETLTH